MPKFKITLQVVQDKPVVVEATSTDELRLKLIGAVEQAAPGWLASLGEYAPYFNYYGESPGDPWSGLPNGLRKPMNEGGDTASILVGFDIPGLSGRFETLPLEIGWISRKE